MRAFITVVLCVLGLLNFSNGFINAGNVDANNIFQTQINSCLVAADKLEKYCAGNNYNTGQAKQLLLQLRLCYKKLSVITDVLYPYESILLNSPAVMRTEDDNPTIIIEPHGLQQLETLLWAGNSNTRQVEIRFEIAYIKTILLQINSESNRENKFINKNVLYAVRASLVTLVTKTVAGFDGPASLNSIAESIATLESFLQYFNAVQVSNNAVEIDYANIINRQTEAAISFLKSQRSFNKLDRATFTRDYINALSESVTKVVVLKHIIDTTERSPVNPFANNLFDKYYFDANFFSPNRRYAFTRERMLLGKKLFNDKRLSASNQRSCAGCHQPSKAFTDGLQVPLALDGKSPLRRNTPTLLNALFQTKQFYDSRETMLELQVSSVVHNKREMGGSLDSFVLLLQNDEEIALQFAAAYPLDAQPVSRYTVANAIANYMRSLQSFNSAFDKYMRNEKVAFTTAEKNGFNLFMGKAKCGTCHFMPLFNGLLPPVFNETESEVIGVPASLHKPYRLDADSGKYYFTNSAADLYAFKTPTLRNIAITAPYMHNGVYKTLQAVIDFYNNGGGRGLGIAPTNQTLPFEKLNLSKKEKKDIIAFLYTLTDTSSYK